MDTQTLQSIFIFITDRHPGWHGHPDSYINVYIQPVPKSMDTQTVKELMCTYSPYPHIHGHQDTKLHIYLFR